MSRRRDQQKWLRCSEQRREAGVCPIAEGRLVWSNRASSGQRSAVAAMTGGQAAAAAAGAAAAAAAAAAGLEEGGAGPTGRKKQSASRRRRKQLMSRALAVQQHLLHKSDGRKALRHLAYRMRL
jgi:hypothetical protein